jgi:DNA invertase Pin-like site-specific DNA recombinase
VENSGKSEQVDVIANQIEICKSYIAERPYLNLIDTYVDNGRTGTVFDRPEFNRLMTDIKSGRVKCLVVRDLSRFGRDYIETGTYLERIFPQIGLRFIAIKELYDSFDTDGSNESLFIPLQNMIIRPVLQGHFTQGFHCTESPDGARDFSKAQPPVWVSLG